MATFSWDRKGVIQLDLLQERRTINAEYYFNSVLGEVGQDPVKEENRRKLDFLPSRQYEATYCQKNHGNDQEAKEGLPSPPTLEHQVIFFIIWET